MKIEFSRIPLDIRAQEFKIADTVKLSATEFEKFCKHLNDDYDFIAKDANKYRVDEEGVAHCLLVLGKGQDDGILVLSEGYSYARHTAYLPYAKIIVQMEKYPSLKDFAEKMEIFADSYAEKALQNQENGSYTITVKDLPDEYENPWFDYTLFGDMLADRKEFESVDVASDGIEIEIAEEFVKEQEENNKTEDAETEGFTQSM